MAILMSDEHAPAPVIRLTAPQRPALSLSDMQLMGILNLTPDSFSDGGDVATAAAAVARALVLAHAGAAVIDIGGESTRPGAMRISTDEQIVRVVEPLRAIRTALDEHGFESVWISVDTTRALVAEAALDAGASLLNDVSAGRDDPAMFTLAAARGVPIALMHMLGEPATMQAAPSYEDVNAEVTDFLTARAAAARAAGIPATQILLDPGIGFGKRLPDNLDLLQGLGQRVASARDQGHSILLGASRKRFISDLAAQVHAETPTSVQSASSFSLAPTVSDPKDRLPGTLAAAAMAEIARVAMLRVHDVAEHAQFLRVFRGVHSV